MRFLDEYRDPAAAQALLARIAATVTQPWRIMEVCGGQTHAILEYGLDRLLPEEITLLHGPGCPVCVTPVGLIDRAVALAEDAGVVLCSFGDMLRVPGGATACADGSCTGPGRSLLDARAAGADVRVVYSPLDALDVAAQEPEREVVFFGVGFETTAPTVAMAVVEARRRGLENFSVLAAHVRVPPAIRAVAAGGGVQGFLAAGHVCTVMGTAEYEPLTAELGLPVVVAGFQPVDILEGVLSCVQQLEAGEARVHNAYARSVRPEGNLPAQRLLTEVFEPVDRDWRGLGTIPRSGLGLRASWRDLDAEHRFPDTALPLQADTRCQAGLVLQGLLEPPDCPEFGRACTPQTPLGAPMVSAEGACAAYERYR